MEGGLRVKFWGTRGSMAAPFPDRMGYGGNTSCVSVEWEEGMAVFDGGTGLLALGQYLKDRHQKISIFISHLHLDHIMGLSLFPCLFRKEASVDLYGPCEEGESFRRRLSRIYGHPYWPVPADQWAARVAWHDGRDGDLWTLPGDVTVQAMESCHPDGGIIFRLEGKGRSVVYGLDCEIGDRSGELWGKYRDFARDCGLLIFDAPYGQEEYGGFRGYGHGFWQQGLSMAKECGARGLCICHHDWGRTDEQLADMERQARKAAKGWGGQVFFAREAMEIRLGS